VWFFFLLSCFAVLFTFFVEGIEGTTTVAVKTLKENAGEREKCDLLSELEVMKKLEPHPNVVTLLGCCTIKGSRTSPFPVYFFFLV
jgi:hypothetical protein